MRSQIVGAGLLGAVLVWGTAAAYQDARSTPGLGTGTVRVVGAVDVANTPTVEAMQSGPWAVTLAAPADVRLTGAARVALSPPPFIQARGRYLVTWPGGEREMFTVDQVGGEGWLRIVAEGRQRWVNVAMARSIEEVR